MKILIIVPARAGSVRLPKKNFRLLGDRPLIEWTVKFSENLLYISDVLVSTDSNEIANHAKKAGALVPWLRPSYLSEADSKSEDVVEHSLNWYEKNVSEVNGVILLQPTSPFRNIESVNTQIKKFHEERDLSIIGVYETTHNPIWELVNGGRFLSKVAPGEQAQASRTFSPCGNFYLTSTKEFKDNHSFFGARTIPFEVTKCDELVDIDTIEDFEEAEKILTRISYPY